jgi:hypothetical protein
MASPRCLSATLLIVGMILALPSNRVHALESKPMRWLLTGKAVAALASNSDVLTILNGAKPFVMSRQPIQGVVLTSGTRSMFSRSRALTTSEARSRRTHSPLA